jgi:hypothetical protein
MRLSRPSNSSLRGNSPRQAGLGGRRIAIGKALAAHADTLKRHDKTVKRRFDGDGHDTQRRLGVLHGMGPSTSSKNRCPMLPQ